MEDDHQEQEGEQSGSTTGLAIATLFAAVVLMDVLEDDEEASVENCSNAEEQDEEAADVIALKSVFDVARHYSKNKRLLPSGDGEEDARKRTYIKWNWERARACIHEDYLGPTPRFRDRQFERVFRISRNIADELLTILAHEDTFFTERCDGLGKQCIDPKAKLLYVLKLLAYGVSPSAFQDYFEMGLSTAHKALSKLCKIVCSHTDLHYFA